MAAEPELLVRTRAGECPQLRGHPHKPPVGVDQFGCDARLLELRDDLLHRLGEPGRLRLPRHFVSMPRDFRYAVAPRGTATWVSRHTTRLGSASLSAVTPVPPRVGGATLIP